MLPQSPGASPNADQSSKAWPFRSDGCGGGAWVHMLRVHACVCVCVLLDNVMVHAGGASKHSTQMNSSQTP
jgi:hypothetical protein